MSLASRISAAYRWPSWTVRLDGRVWRHAMRATLSQSYGAGIAAGDLEGRDPPVEIVEGVTTVSWSWGYDGFEVTGFTGIVTKVLQRSYPNRISLAVADPLWLADIRRSDIATTPLNNITAKTAVEQILTNAGLTRLNIPAFPASGSAWAGSEWVLGTLTPVSWKNTTALAAARSICEALGYWLFADAGGTVQAVAMERAPTDAPFRTLRYGTDFLLAGPPERSRDAASVKNRVVVRGANTGVEGAQIVDARQTGAADRTYEYSNSLIEYVNASQAGAASAESIATRLLSLWSRQPNIISVGRLKADPRLRVGMTIAVECSLIGLSSARPFFIYGVTTTFDAQSGAFHQSLTLDGGIGDEGYTTIPPPIAGFTWTIIKETLNGTGVIELLLDGSSSLSLTDGEIVAWAWSTSTATALSTPTTASGVLAMFVYPGATTSAEVTLTVTDTSSKQTSLTQTINLLGDELVQPTSSVISLALGSAWAVTPDGGATWNVEATGDATMVPERGPLVATVGTGSIGIRSTEDALQTASETVDADLAGGLITAMGYTPDSTRQWAAVGTTLYRTLDNWTTATLWGTLSATITAIIEDPALENSVFVLASNSLYQSAIATTPGTVWFVLYEGPTGATARHLARGQSGATTWISFTGTFSGSPLHRVEGPITASFPVLSPTVNEIRAMALSPDETTVYCWDQEGRGFSVDSTTGVGTALSADLSSGETAQHATHEDDAPIVYLASFGATEGTTYKYLPLVPSAGLLSFYTPAAGQQAHRVGIGEPVVIEGIEIVMVNDAIWHHTVADGWVDKTTGLPSGWTWYEVQVNALNPDDWLVRGDNGTVDGATITSGGQPILWRTLDAGATWNGISVEAPSTSGWGAGDQMCGHTSDGNIFLMRNTSDPRIWRGSASPLPVAYSGVAPGANVALFSAVPGLGGEIVFLEFNYNTPSGRKLYVLPAGSTTATLIVSALNIVYSARIERLDRFGRSIIVQGQSATFLPTYQAGTGQVTISALRGYAIAGVTTNWVGAWGDNIVKAFDSANNILASSGLRYESVFSDAQTRTVCAVWSRAGAESEQVWFSEDSGYTWTALPGPPSFTPVATTTHMAVIVRETEA